MQEKQFAPLNKRILLIYIFIALGFTWVCWIPALVWAKQNGYALPTISNLATETPFTIVNQQHLWYSLLFRLAVYGPLISGLVATAMLLGKPGVRALFSRILHWRIAGKWYGTAVLLALIITATPLLIGLLIGIILPKAGGAPAILSLFLILFLNQLVTSGLGEEPGWRGYLLPTLQASYPQGKAIWIMGIIWSIWHYPFIIYVTLNALDPALDVPAVAVIVPALLGNTMALVGIAYLYAWLLNHTQSLLLLIIFHALTNVLPELAARFFESNQLTFILMTIMPWIIVVVLEKRLGKERFPGAAQVGFG